jgi:hypothetical protein
MRLVQIEEGINIYKVHKIQEILLKIKKFMTNKIKYQVSTPQVQGLLFKCVLFWKGKSSYFENHMLKVVECPLFDRIIKLFSNSDQDFWSSPCDNPKFQIFMNFIKLLYQYE